MLVDTLKLFNDKGPLSENLINNKDFIKSLSNINDVSKYRLLINKLQKNNPISFINEIELKRKKYYDDLFSSYDSRNQMFSKYKNLLDFIIMKGFIDIDYGELSNFDIYSNASNQLKYNIQTIIYNKSFNNEEKKESLISIFQKESSTEYSDSIIDYYFKEIPYNFLKDLSVLLSFNLNDPCISIDHLNFYKKLLKSRNEIDLEFYNKIDKNINYEEMFYDDFLLSRKKSYDMLNKALTKPNKKNLNQELTSKYGVDVYEFRGNPFYLIIHNTSIYKHDHYNVKELIERNNNEFQPSIIFGFSRIDIENIIHVHETDSFSSLRNENISKRVNGLYTPNKLVLKTKGYNEIVIKNTRKIKPDFIICFNDISDMDIKTAKQFDVPIINIDKTMYKNQYVRSNILMGNDGDTYIDSYLEIENINKIRH